MTAVADLARKLAVSRGTVTNRMQRLQDAQVIVGYTVRLKPDAEPERIRAWMGVTVEGNQSRAAALLGIHRATLRSPACWASRECRRCTTPTAAGICWPSCRPIR